MDYLLFDASPFGFPPPGVPVMPPLRRGALRWRADPQRLVPAWAGSGRLYSRARYALHDAFKLSSVGAGGALLAPAYHCRTMIDPALALGAAVQLYALHDDLSADLGDIERQLTDSRLRVKAVLASHFFGVPQDLRALADLCRKHGATLVEDCAHALPLRAPSNAMGSTGTWCVASPYKFFPCEDGGALWSGDGRPLDLPPLRAPGLRAELGQLRRMLAKARQRTPPRVELPSPPPPSDLELQAQAVASRSDGPSHDYQPARESVACTAVSRWIVNHGDIAQILLRRRTNYQRWIQAAKSLPHARALRPLLGQHDTPYMFPLLIDQPQRHFAPLKRAGLPIWRWDSLATSNCTVAARYRQQLLHLPCHQSLSDSQMEWMVQTLGQVLRGKPADASA